MASDGELNVKIGSSYDPSGLKAADDALNKIVGSSTKASQALAKSAQIASTSGRAIAKGANEAGFALTNLGRVAQDAPFGFIGIQNNLNPLLESFGRLRQETGSNALALKSLAGSLVGPAGLGLALSVVSSAILFYQQYQQKANKVTNDAKKDTDDYINALGQLEQANLKGAQNASKELTALQILYARTQDVTRSTEDRLKSVNDLQAKYPAYFKNVKDEAFLVGGAATKYNELTQAILATARARAAEDLISKNTGRQLTNEQKIIDATIEYDKQRLISRNALNKLKDPANSGSAIGLASEAAKAEERQADAAKIIRDLRKDNIILGEKNLVLVKNVNTQLDLGGDIAQTSADKVVDASTKIEKALKRVKDVSSLGGASTTTLGISAGDLQGVGNPTIGAVQLPTQGITEYQRLVEAAITSTNNFEDSLKQLGEQAIAPTLYDAFSSIGVALAEGASAIDAFGNALLGAFAGFLSQLGQMFIKEGIAQVTYGIAKNLILPGSGTKNILGGAGMITAGAGISVFSGAIKGKKSGGSNFQSNAPRQFANGGVVYGNTYAQIGEYPGAKTNPEVVAPLDKLKTMLGDRGGNVNLSASLGISMRQLVVAIDQERKLMGRAG